MNFSLVYLLVCLALFLGFKVGARWGNRPPRPGRIEIPSNLFQELVNLAWCASTHTDAHQVYGTSEQDATNTAQAAQNTLDRFNRAK